MPRFSVIIPAFRAERFIAEAIDSVLNQTRPNWELIVVDDASPDNVATVVQTYLRDPRIRLLRLTTNVGLSAARNTGARLARGALLTMLDSDDWLDDGYLARIGAEFDRRPDVALVGVAVTRHVTEDGKPAPIRISRRSRRPPGDDPAAMLRHVLRGPHIYHGCTYRRSVYEQIGGYDPEFRFSEDVEMWARVAYTGHRISVINDQLYVYRLSSKSLMRRPGRERQVAEEQLAMLDRISKKFVAPTARARTIAPAARLVKWVIARLDTQDGLAKRDWTAARRSSRLAVRYRATPRTLAVALATLLPSALLSRLYQRRRDGQLSDRAPGPSNKTLR